MTTPTTTSLPVVTAAPRCWVHPAVWVAGLTLIFGAGVVTGMAGYAYWHHSFLLWMREHPEQVPDMLVDKLKSSLSLSPEQVPRVEALIRKYHQSFDSIQAEIHPRIDAECRAYETEMQNVLTPEQYAKWEPKFREIRKIFLP